MPIIKKLEYDDEEKKTKKVTKPTKKKKNEPVTGTSTTVPSSKSKKSSLLGFVVTIVIVAILAGTAIAYTKGKVTQVQKGGTEKTQILEAQVEALKNEIKALKDTTSDLAKQSESNKEIVIDLFDKNRSIPTDVNTDGWQTYKDDSLQFEINYPMTWQIVSDSINSQKNPFQQPEKTPVEDPVPAEGENNPLPPVQNTVYFQPINNQSFAKAITLKNDYLNFSGLSLVEKYDIFKDLELLDQRDFAQGKMLYFIDLGENNETIPTVLILTDQSIFRATFNVKDKTLDEYVSFRKDFEDIASTFNRLVPPPPTEEEKKEDE